MLPLILQELGADSSEVEFDLKEASDDRMLLELLERGELDVAFVELPVPDGTARGDAAARRPVRADRPRGARARPSLDRPLTLDGAGASCR